MNSPSITISYPSLYYSADGSSSEAQKFFLWTVRGEFGALLIISFLVSLESEKSRLIITLLLIVLAVLLSLKVAKKLDQEWYKCRALAESIKTSTWRFCMRAQPFADAESIQEPISNFRNYLREILRLNSHRELISFDGDQVTNSMLALRKLPLEERLSYYVTNRVDEQRSWYTKKAKTNRKALRIWVTITSAVYLFSAISLYAEQLHIGMFRLAFDPLIVFATSIIGWIQIKKFGELSASYILTAHEIGIIKSNAMHIKDEEDFSSFINESELAFSREHTQWVARKDAS